jgi:hypothetical protein
MFVTNSILMDKLVHLEKKINRIENLVNSNCNSNGDSNNNSIVDVDELKCYFKNLLIEHTNEGRLEKSKFTKLILEEFLDISKKITRNTDILNNLNGTIDANNTTINSKLDGLFFENEILKHQLSLEDDIRRYIQEINDLSETVNQNIKIIDEYLTICK